jgi:hypothetical protein
MVSRRSPTGSHLSAQAGPLVRPVVLEPLERCLRPALDDTVNNVNIDHIKINKYHLEICGI